MLVLLNFLVDAIFIGGLLVWAWVIARLWRHQSLLPYEPRRNVPWGGIDLAVVIAAIIFLQGLCLGVAVKWSGVEMPTDWSDFDPHTRFIVLSANVAANVLTLIVAAIILFWQTDADWSDLGVDLGRASYDVRCGVIAFAAAAPAVFGLQRLITTWIPYHHQLVTAVQEKNDVAMWIVAALSAAIVAPLFEEFFFRVLLQGWLEKIEVRLARGADAEYDAADSDIAVAEDKLVPGPAGVPLGVFGLSLGLLPVVISSTLFALMHWGQGARPIPLFVFALVLGFLYQRTHRVLPSLTVHVLLNSVSLAVFFVEPKA